MGGTVGRATTAAGTAASAGRSEVNSTLNSAARVGGSAEPIGGLNASGQLSANSRGVFKLSGITLNSAASSGAQGSVVTSTGKNVHLDRGTRMVLATQSANSAPSK